MKSLCIFVLALATVYCRSAGGSGSSRDPVLRACSSDDLCKHAHGTFQYKPKPRYFFTCKGDLNSGCQKCATANLIYWEKCDACFSKSEVKEDKECPKPAPVGDIDLCAPAGFCKHRPDGMYADPFNYQKFFSCVNKVATQCQKCGGQYLIFVQACNECSNVYYYDPKHCPRRSSSGIASQKCSSNFCMHKADGDYEVDTHSGTYYTCTEGTCLIRNCPAGTVFVQHCSRRCWSTYFVDSAHCPYISTVTAPPAKQCDPAYSCAGVHDGNYERIYGVDDNEYYACANGNCYVQNCPAALVFSQGKDACVSPSH